VGCNKKAVTRG